MRAVYREALPNGLAHLSNYKEHATDVFSRALNLLIEIERFGEVISRDDLRFIIVFRGRSEDKSDIQPDALYDDLNKFQRFQISELKHVNDQKTALEVLKNPTGLSNQSRVGLEFDAYADRSLKLLSEIGLISENNGMMKVTAKGILIVACHQDLDDGDIKKTLARLI